jgi:hypothetical protein
MLILGEKSQKGKLSRLISSTGLSYPFEMHNVAGVKHRSDIAIHHSYHHHSRKRKAVAFQVAA